MRSRTPDRLCAEAVDVALAVTEEAAGPDAVGEHLGVVAEGDRVVTHLFACTEPAYRGWQWATTLTRASRAKAVTIDETVLLPGPEAVLAPKWVPWSDRLRPGDLGPGDLLPTEADDLRLEPGWTGGATPTDREVEELAAAAAETGGAEDGEAGRARGAGAAGESDGADEGRAAGEADGVGGVGGVGGGLVAAAAERIGEIVETDESVAEAVAGALAGGAAQGVITPPPSVAMIGAVATQLGFGRPRVLSRHGLHIAADRWEEEFGPKTAMAQAAPANCGGCGFLLPIAGSLRQAFGVCANEYSPADGRMVSLDYGCGAHSEAAVMPNAPSPAPMVLDEYHDTDPMALHADPQAPADPADPQEDAPGHA